MPKRAALHHFIRSARSLSPGSAAASGPDCAGDCPDVPSEPADSASSEAPVALRTSRRDQSIVFTQNPPETLGAMFPTRTLVHAIDTSFSSPNFLPPSLSAERKPSMFVDTSTARFAEYSPAPSVRNARSRTDTDVHTRSRKGADNDRFPEVVLQ